MKPPPFEYSAPTSIEETLQLLAQHGDSAKLLAGGQSLLPMLNFRLLEPGIIVDLNRVGELDWLSAKDDSFAFGALIRHAAMERARCVREQIPILATALGHVGHLAIRNRGTLVGSLCHADPAAEVSAIAQLLDAKLTVRSMGSVREIAAGEFFTGALETVLAPNELVTGVELCLPRSGRWEQGSGVGWGFREVARRAGDFALAGAAVVVLMSEGLVSSARVALFGVYETVVRVRELEKELEGTAGAREFVEQAVGDLVTSFDMEPLDDLHASPKFRVHLGQKVICRALSDALRRARESE